MTLLNLAAKAYSAAFGRGTRSQYETAMRAVVSHFGIWEMHELEDAIEAALDEAFDCQDDDSFYN